MHLITAIKRVASFIAEAVDITTVKTASSPCRLGMKRYPEGFDLAESASPDLAFRDPVGERVREGGKATVKGGDMSELEKRVEALERQMAEVLAFKREADREKLIAEFRSSTPATDAFWVGGGHSPAKPGLYCKHCLWEHGRLTELGVKFDDVPGGRSGRLLEKLCPECGVNLKIQFENR